MDEELTEDEWDEVFDAKDSLEDRIRILFEEACQKLTPQQVVVLAGFLNNSIRFG